MSASALYMSRNVLVHCAYAAQRALESGVLDELQIHQIPRSSLSRLPTLTMTPTRTSA